MGPETIYRPWDTQTPTSRQGDLLTGCWLASAMAQGEDEEMLKIEMKAGCADCGVVEIVNFDCVRRRKKRRGREDGRGGSMTRANDRET